MDLTTPPTEAEIAGWPEHAGWRDPPEGWEAYRAVQAAGVGRGWALSWNGAHYSLWRPGWQYSYSPTLAPLEASIATGSARPLKGLATEPPAPAQPPAEAPARSASGSAAGDMFPPPSIPGFGVAVWCGDCREGLAGLPTQSVDVIFADPPYFTGNTEDQTADYTVSEALAAQGWTNFHADWDNQWATWAEYQEWCATWLSECRRVLRPRGSIWICGSYHNIPRVGVVLQDQGWYVNRWISWYKPNAFPNRRMDKPAASTEIVIWARPSKDVTSLYHADVARYYGGGKNLRDMWAIPMDAARARRLKAHGFHHPSKKPPALVERCLRLSAPREGAVIADPFGGSGTTGECVLAQQAAGWRGLLMESKPEYAAAIGRLLAAPAQQAAPFVVAAD